MFLYQCKLNSRIKVLKDYKGPPASPDFKAGDLLFFGHCDGMYSLCHDKHGNIVHLPAWAEVEIVLDKEDEV